MGLVFGSRERCEGDDHSVWRYGKYGATQIRGPKEMYGIGDADTDDDGRSRMLYCCRRWMVI